MGFIWLLGLYQRVADVVGLTIGTRDCQKGASAVLILVIAEP